MVAGTLKQQMARLIKKVKMIDHLSSRMKKSADSQRNIEAGAIKKGDIIELKLNQIKACQPAIGKDQVFYKVGRFDGVNWVPEGDKPVAGRTFSDDEKLFDDVASANGQKVDQAKIFRLSNSAPGDPESYLVIDEDRQIIAPGTMPDAMKTVVIGPDGNNYLTDGHHTVNTFSTIKRGGMNDFSLNLVVEANRSKLKDQNNNGSSMDEFWKKMANEGNAWLKVLRNNKPGYRYLKGVNGSNDSYKVKSIDLDSFEGQLPQKMKPNAFKDDPYRAIINFTRGIAWESPKETKAEGLPFLEFYWSEEIQSAINEGEKKLDVHTNKSIYDLNDLNSYVSAIQTISDWIINLSAKEVIGTSGFTAREMGQMSGIDEDALNQLINSGQLLEASSSDEQDAVDVPRFGKLGYTWAQQHPSVQSRRRFRQGEASELQTGSVNNDTLTGHSGADIYVLSPGRDVVTDFTPGDDSIGISDITDLRFRQKPDGLLIRSGDKIRTMLLDVQMDEFLVETSAHLKVLPGLQDALI